jgi:hypothetical protein
MKRQIGLLAAAALLASGVADIAGAHAIKTKGAGGVDCVPSAPVPDAAVAADPHAIKTKGAGANDRLGEVHPDIHRPPLCCSNARAPAAGSTDTGSKTKSSAGPVAAPNTWTLPVCHA